MEYHDQPLEFISNYYFQAKDEEVTNRRISFIMIAVAYIPLVLIPIISQLTITYIYPVLLYTLNNSFSRRSSAMISGTMIGINIITVLDHIYSFIRLNQYSNEVLDDSYDTTVFVGTVLSSFATVTVYATAMALWIRKHINFAATSISVNIIHMSYFFTVMMLAFLQDPLIITFYYSALIFDTLCYMIYFVQLSKVCANLDTRCGSLFLYIAMPLGLIFSACISLLISSVFSMGGFSDSPALQMLILSLLIGLLSYCIFKPVYKEAYKHVKLNKVANVEEENETTLSIIISKGSNKTKSKNQREEEMDVNDQNNKLMYTTV